MVIITFNYKDIRYTFKNIFYLYMVSIILGGFLYLLNIDENYQESDLNKNNHLLANIEDSTLKEKEQIDFWNIKNQHKEFIEEMKYHSPDLYQQSVQCLEKINFN